MTLKDQLKPLNNTELIQLFEAVRDQLKLKTITEFSKSNGMAYNTAKKMKPYVSVCGTKYLPDNGRK